MEHAPKADDEIAAGTSADWTAEIRRSIQQFILRPDRGSNGFADEPLCS